MTRPDRLKVFSTGNLTADAAGAVSFSSTTASPTVGKINGMLEAIRYETNPSATIKIYLADTSGANYSIQIPGSGTDVVIPAPPLVTESGAAIATNYGTARYPLIGDINIDITGAGNASGVQVDLWYR